MEDIPVSKIQHFSTKDGPGIRTTVFLKGCPLRCVWCHNPETQSVHPDFFYSPQLCTGCRACAEVCPAGVHRFIRDVHVPDRSKCIHCMRCIQVCPANAIESCSRSMTAAQIYSEIIKDLAFYGKEGGVTFSGGEPTIHFTKLLPLLQRLKQEHIHITMDTSGYFSREISDNLADAADLFLWDIKDTSDARHMEYTGVSNRQILENLKYIDALGGSTVLRCIMVNTVNFNRGHLDRLIELYHSLKHCKGVELLPYHTFGDNKNLQLGMASKAEPQWIPKAEDMQKAEAYLSRSVKLIHN